MLSTNILSFHISIFLKLLRIRVYEKNYAAIISRIINSGNNVSFRCQKMWKKKKKGTKTTKILVIYFLKLDILLS